MLEFDTGIGSCEVPVGRGFAGVAVVLPGGDFLDEGVFVGDPSVEALGGWCARARSSQDLQRPIRDAIEEIGQTSCSQGGTCG